MATFLTAAEMGTNIYDYQVDVISEGNDDIMEFAIEAAIDEVKSYLTANNKKEFEDGRIIYDVDAIFSQTGTGRNSLILQMTKTVAKWHFVELCNADIIYETAKERYDRAVEYLTKIQKGEVTIPSLPTIESEDVDPNKLPFRYGSRKKFNHE